MGQFAGRAPLSCNTIHFKMNALIVLTFAASAMAAPQLPAGLTAAACPNYPYCNAVGGFLEVPNVPGAADVIAAQEAVIRSGLNPLSGLPGIDADAALKEASREGFSGHAAAEAAVLLAQGRVPANLDAGRLAHFQAEQAVRANEAALVVNRG